MPRLQIVLATTLLGAALAASAQDPTQDRLFIRTGPPPGNSVAFGEAGGMAAGTIQYLAHESSFEGKVVKGVPYSAEAVTEVSQTLADGNRIHRKVTAHVYRDSEGRTRREQTPIGIGPFIAKGDAPATILINDPVSGAHYVLNPEQKIAHKMPAPNMPPRISNMPATVVASREQARVKDESLGTQIMEGVSVQGTRNTLTIPAGEMGNERPIDVVSETWYSPDVQAVVMSKHSDPRMGETVYRLINIDRSEPPHSLFEVPADYTVREGPMMFIQKLKTAPK